MCLTVEEQALVDNFNLFFRIGNIMLSSVQFQRFKNAEFSDVYYDAFLKHLNQITQT